MISSKFRCGYFGIGPVLVAGLLSVTLTDIFWTKLGTFEKYPDPVAGMIAWSAVGKNVDLHALIFLIATTGFLTVTISALCHGAASQGPESETGNHVNQFLLLSLIPAGWRIGVALLHPMNQVPPLRTLSIFPVGAVAVIAGLLRFRNVLQAKDIFVIGGACLLAPVIAFFSLLGFAVAILRLVPRTVATISPWVAPLALAFAVGIVLVLLVIFACSATLETLQQRVLRCLRTCQYPLPLLFFYLLPTPLIDATHRFHHHYPTGLAITLAACGLICVWHMHRRFVSSTIEIDRPLVKALSPISVAAMAIIVQCGISALPFVPADLFHSGEALLPWQQLWDFHAVPYIDFAPVHGLMEILRGALNQLFFDGTYRNYDQAYILVSGISVVATVLAMAEVATSLGALFLLLTVLPDMDRMYFVAAPLLLIASPRLLKRPTLWLLIWQAICLFSCAYNPAMGPAFTLGTLPVALWQLYRAGLGQRLLLAVLVVVDLVIVGLVFKFQLSREIVLGFFHFILDNQWTNEAANGIAWLEEPWRRDRKNGIGTSQLLWETVRLGWIAVALGASVFYWKQWSKAKDQRNLSLMTLCAVTPPTLICSSLWVLERFDIGLPGRSSTLTQVALFAILPVLFFLVMPRRHAGLIVLFLATFVGLIGPMDLPTANEPDILVQKSLSVRNIYPEWTTQDGADEGLPRLGDVIRSVPGVVPERDVVQDARNLKADLTQWLHPGETFLDLSNQSAFYYYLDMRCPVQYASYVACNSRMQDVMMRQLAEHPVPVVLIGPCGWLDGVPMSIRCYRPYHDYILKFAAVSRDGFTYLIDPAREPGIGPIGSESQLKSLDPFFARVNLLRLPIAWGESWPAMQDRFVSVAKAQPASIPSISPANNALTFTIPSTISSGVDADFVRFRFKFNYASPKSYRIARAAQPAPDTNSEEPQLCLTWVNTDGSTSDPILFKAETGDVVVPLGSYPRWLLGHGFRTLTVRLENLHTAKAMQVSDIEFLRLKPR